MKILYIDESGDLGPLPAIPRHQDQPVFVMGGLIVDSMALGDLTRGLLTVKNDFFPSLRVNSPGQNWLDLITAEIKGAGIREKALRGAPVQQRHAFGFMDKVLALLERYDAKIIARVWVKGLGCPFKGRSIYTSSVQDLYKYFDDYLARNDDVGVCIADSRKKHMNANVAHSIFTRKYSHTNPLYTNICELPSFSHSENHAGIQLCDFLCSAFLYPMATYTYCSDHVNNVHVQSSAQNIKSRYGQRLRALQHRYQDPPGQWTGGIVVSDRIGRRPGSLMF
ncbi:MAG: DUF3800 domain-containing protein [Alphaproteobacteria bacterium]